MSKAKTVEQVREEFLLAIRGVARYWAKENCTSELDRCEGVVHSILNIIDGSSGAFGAFLYLVTGVPEEDKQFNINNGDDWIEDGTKINSDCLLHELFYTDKMKIRSQEEAKNNQIAVADDSEKLERFKASLVQVGGRLNALRNKVIEEEKAHGKSFFTELRDQCQQEYTAFEAVIKQLEKES